MRRRARLHDDEPIEGRLDVLLTPTHILRPELELPAPARIPVLVQVEQGVDSSIQLELVVPIEVGVNREARARATLVKAAPRQVTICDQAADARQLLQESHEGRGVEHEQHVVNEGGDSDHVAGVADSELARLRALIIAAPDRRVGARKIADDLTDHLGRQ